MTEGELGGSGVTLTVLSLGTHESGAGGIQVGERVGGSDARKSPSAATDKAGTRGRHGARPGQGEKYGGRWENVGGVTSGVRGNKGGCEASVVDHDSHVVGEGKGGRKASGVAEYPGGGRHRVGRGVESPQVADNPEWPRGPGGVKPQEAPQRLKKDRGRTDGGGGEGKKTRSPTNQPGCREPTAATASQWADS